MDLSNKTLDHIWNKQGGKYTFQEVIDKLRNYNSEFSTPIFVGKGYNDLKWNLNNKYLAGFWKVCCDLELVPIEALQKLDSPMIGDILGNTFNIKPTNKYFEAQQLNKEIDYGKFMQPFKNLIEFER